MESSVNNGMCRCCASEGTFKDVKSAYHWMGEEEVYWNMLQECFDVALTTTDNGDDGGICEVCITQLRNASNFKKQVQHTEEQFKLRIQGKLFKSDIVKLEPAKDEESDNSDHLETEDFSGTEFEIPIKTETVEEPKPKKRAAAPKASTSRAKKAKANDGETSTKRIITDETVLIKIEPEVSNTVTSVEAESLQYSAVTKGKKGRSKSLRKRSVSFTKKVNVKTALKRTYTKDKSIEMEKHSQNIRMILLHSNATPIKAHSEAGYACCFCNVQMRNAADLKKHTLETHDDSTKHKFIENLTMRTFVIKLDITSLQCNICCNGIEGLDQLMEHLNTHNHKIYTNVKNHILPFKFVNEVPSCGVCCKSFNIFKTVQEHMSVHYRNYICDICNAAFITRCNLQSHCRRHERGELVLKKRSERGKTITYNDLSELIKHKYNIRMVLNCSNATPIRQRGGIGYACCFCNNQYPDPADLKRHTIGEHDDDVRNTFMEKVLMYSYVVKLDITTLSCKLCGHATDALDDLIDHLVNVHSKVYYTDVKNHIMSFKFEDDELRCIVCQKVFTRFKLLQQHTTRHYKNHICDSCGAGFINRRQLAVHCDIHRTGNYKCEYCPKVFSTNQKRKSHEVCVHTQPMRLKCAFCDEKFTHNRARDTHLQRKHGVDVPVYKCNRCDKKYSNSMMLSHHIKRDHLLERSHECTECDMSFYTKRCLQKHMRKHVGQRKFK